MYSDNLFATILSFYFEEHIMFPPKSTISWGGRSKFCWFIIAVMAANCEGAKDKKRAQEVLEIQAHDSQ